MNLQIKLGDLEVNRLGFGAMRVCGPSIWGPPKDRKQAHRVFRRAIELGVNFFDTADSYGPHVDEELIAEALHPYPKGLVIATKGGLVRPSPSRWDEDGRPEHLKRAIDGKRGSVSALRSSPPAAAGSRSRSSSAAKISSFDGNPRAPATAGRI